MFELVCVGVAVLVLVRVGVAVLVVVGVGVTWSPIFSFMIIGK